MVSGNAGLTMMSCIYGYQCAADVYHMQSMALITLLNLALVL
jgi:hypothetical protein